MMIFLAVIFISISLIMIITSSWKFDKLILVSFILGLIFLNISSYSREGFVDYLLYLQEFIFIGFLYFVIAAHKIMGTDILTVFSRNEFKEFLVSNNLFHGVNKFVYDLPIYIGLFILLGIVAYYIAEPSSLNSIMEFFQNY